MIDLPRFAINIYMEHRLPDFYDMELKPTCFQLWESQENKRINSTNAQKTAASGQLFFEKISWL